MQRALAVITRSVDEVEENVLELDDMLSACGGSLEQNLVRKAAQLDLPSFIIHYVST